MVISSVHSDAFTYTSSNIITCTLINIVDDHDQSTIPHASSDADNVNITGGINVASFDEPENYLTATTFLSIFHNARN